MVSEEFVYWSVVLGVIVGLGLLVYGMSLTSGKSMNTPAIVGGVLSLGAVGVMSYKIARLEHPAH